MSDLLYACWFKISGILYICHTALWNLQTTQRKTIPAVSASNILDLKKKRVISGTIFLCHIKPQAVDDRDMYRLKAQKVWDLNEQMRNSVLIQTWHKDFLYTMPFTPFRAQTHCG